ncbi:MAG: DUF2085 domain-containing protein [Anaerolineae bacterium]|nr:DUF2085 domain-containing protein [Anaerolineae bacterium]
MAADGEGLEPAQARSVPGWERRLVVEADRAIYWLTRHWALVFNGLFLLVVGLAFAAPLLQAAGLEGPGSALFRAYRRVCHQYPERSFYVYGRQVAFCQRDVGVYLGLFLGGLAYAASSGRARLSNTRIYLLVFVLPVAVDGLTQLLGLRTSAWPLRLGTGLLFGVGTALFAYPFLRRGMDDTRRELEQRFGPGLRQLRGMER